MKIRPKTFKLLKELLLEKGGVFYMNNHVIDFEYNGHSFVEPDENYQIYNSKSDMKLWLGYDDWYIKV